MIFSSPWVEAGPDAADRICLLSGA